MWSLPGKHLKIGRPQGRLCCSPVTADLTARELCNGMLFSQMETLHNADNRKTSCLAGAYSVEKKFS